MSARTPSMYGTRRGATAIRAILALCLPLGTFALTGGAPVAATTPGSRIIAVPAYAPINRNALPPVGDIATVWIDTGLALRPGLFVLIRARGTASCTRDWPCLNGPEGTGTFACPATCAAPGLTPYALIGRVGDQAPFVIGGGPVVVVGEGEFSLAFNDGDYTDNTGFFVVTLAYPCATAGTDGAADGYRC